MTNNIATAPIAIPDIDPPDKPDPEELLLIIGLIFSSSFSLIFLMLFDIITS